jgi:hypothetical protein
MKKYILFLTAVLIFDCAKAQVSDKRTWSWYFGSHVAIQFTSPTLPPVPVTTSTMNATEGSSAISDSAGNMLFYTDGQQAWAANNTVMPNGTGLKGHFWSAQSALLVPMPGSNTLFYLFTVNNWTDATTELNYSVIDRTLNGGFGDITSQKNVLINANCREQLTAAYHANGTDIWILSHEFGNSNFVAYRLTSQGLNMTPVVSPAGAFWDSWNRYGYLKVSPHCDKIASALGGDTFVMPDTTVQVCDFDNATGIVSNPVFLADYNAIQTAYGCEFSPDNNKLYVTEFDGTGIYQFDLSVANPATTMTDVASNNQIKSSLTLGPDGKIYVAERSLNELGTIEYPDITGSGCTFLSGSVLLPAGVNTIGSCNVFHTCPNTTSISDITGSQNYLAVFPNPAHSILTVNSSEKIEHLKISDVTGRIVFDNRSLSRSNLLNYKIDVSSFSKGIYFLQAEINGKLFVKKLMVE